MPLITASLPWAMIRRASNGSLAMRNQPLPGPAVLGVDVVHELVDVLVLQAHRVHLVARVLLERIDLAEDLVLHEQVHEHPQAAHVGPLDPLVVALLVGQRGVVGPVLERRPADRVVAAGGVAVEHVLEHRAAAVRGGVVDAVLSA